MVAAELDKTQPSVDERQRGFNHYSAIILFIEAETVNSGIKATVFLWKIFFFFLFTKGKLWEQKVKGEIHKMGKGLKRKHAPPHPKKKQNKREFKIDQNV